MDVFKAISDPTRREILALLSKRDMSAGEIAEQFSMSKPAISKHLEILKYNDLISAEKNGQFIVYSLNMTAMQTMYVKVMEVFSSLKEEGVELEKTNPKQ